MSGGIGIATDFVAHISFTFQQALGAQQAEERTLSVVVTGPMGVVIRQVSASLTAATLSTAAMAAGMQFGATTMSQRFGYFIGILMLYGWLCSFLFLLPALSTFASSMPDSGDFDDTLAAHVSSKQ